MTKSLTILIALVCLHAASWTQALSLESLRSIDEDFSVFTMEFEYREPGLSFDPDQGIKVSQSMITVSPEDMALRMVNSFDKEPIFKHPGTLDYENYDYNPEGDLIIWRTLSKYAFSARDENLSLQKLQSCNIDEARKVTKLGPRYRKTIFDPANPDNLYELQHILLGSGRGISIFLKSIESSHKLENGFWEIHAKGNYGEGISGRWEIQFDPETENLVRLAKFYPNGMSIPYLSVTTEGLVPSPNLSVAAKGTLSFLFPTGYKFEIEIRPTSITSSFDEIFFNEIRATTGKDFPSMKTLDLRQTSKGK